jgi:hypothetical protein
MPVRNGSQGAEDSSGDQGAQQGAQGQPLLPEAYPTTGSTSRKAIEDSIRAKIKKVEEEIAAWRKKHSICDPTSVWDLRELQAELRHWQEMLLAAKN